MPTVDIYNIAKEKVGEVDLKEEIFGVEVKGHLLHEVVTWQRACRRKAGTASTKTRGEVRGGGRKPWRQKGTGRARVGSSRSPIWRGGGTTFGPRPRSYAYALPKKVRRAGPEDGVVQQGGQRPAGGAGRLSPHHAQDQRFVKVMETFNLNKALFVTPEENRAPGTVGPECPGVQVMPTRAQRVRHSEIRVPGAVVPGTGCHRSEVGQMKATTSLIKGPIITEKTHMREGANKLTFRVAVNANKIEIRKAIEDIFKVKVLGVNTITSRARKKRVGKTQGTRPTGKRPWSPWPRERRSPVLKGSKPRSGVGFLRDPGLPGRTAVTICNGEFSVKDN
jgi:large subunit ribosomal protein L4